MGGEGQPTHCTHSVSKCCRVVGTGPSAEARLAQLSPANQLKQNKYYSSDGWVRSTGSLYIAYVNCAALRPKCIRAEDQSRGVNCVIGRNAHL